MIYATADEGTFIPIDNLSTAHKHIGTCTNLCSTVRSTLETYCNLSTAIDLQQSSIPAQGLHIHVGLDKVIHACGTLDNLSSNLTHPF